MGFNNQSTASDIVIALEHPDGREINMRGLKTKEEQFTLSNYEENDDFVANPVDVTFGKIGLDYTYQDINTWAVANGFNFIMDGQGVGPGIESVEIDGTKAIVTITFDENIDNNLADNPALKAAIEIATDGVTFAALAVGDAVSTPDGTGDTLTITFAAPLSTATNKIKIAAGSLKNADGAVNAELITDAIDAS